MFKVDPKPSPTGLSRDNALYMAKKAEEAERYEEMVLYMREIVAQCKEGDEMASVSGEPDPQRGVEERNLISVGYKNIMSQRRTAHRTVMNYSSGEGDFKAQCKAYADKIAQEVFALIDEVIEEIVKPFAEGKGSTQKANDKEVLVFFKKMEGDYNRYGAEITADEKRENYKNKALAAYKIAESLAEDLPSTNPIRLGLALNFSVFYYEICEKKGDACELAKKAFDTAIDHLDTLSEEAYKDSTLIMQLLKDNLTLWTENEDSGDDMKVEEM